MAFMFAGSKFDGDISMWEVSNVIDMRGIFQGSKFKKDLSNWKPYLLENSKEAFLNCLAPIPYWNNCSDNEEILSKIENYELNKNLNKQLSKKKEKKKTKI